MIFLKDVVTHNKKMKDLKKTNSQDLISDARQGIKGLSKGKRRKLEAYQHLFYLLQVEAQSFQFFYVFNFEV